MALYEDQTSIKIPSAPRKSSSKHSTPRPKARYLKKAKKHHRLPYRLRYILFLSAFIIVTLALSHSIPTKSTSPSHQATPTQYKNILDTPTNELVKAAPITNLDNDILQSLINESIDYPEAKILIARANEYPSSLLELAGNRPETLDFVISYTDYKANESSEDSICVAKDYTPGNIPLFLQWDKRWGYDAYGNDFIASSGCGPTCLSMVVVGLLGDTNISPKFVSDFSNDSGYFTPAGTSWLLMTEGANALGLYSETLDIDADSIYSSLEAGQPIICSMGPGHFTKKGHFIVLTDLTKDGQITIHDPASLITSHQTWDLSLLMSEMKCLWAFTPM